MLVCTKRPNFIIFISLGLKLMWLSLIGYLAIQVSFKQMKLFAEKILKNGFLFCQTILLHFFSEQGFTSDSKLIGLF